MKHTEAHISCAGRGYNEQYDAFMRGASRAKWGESSHSWNAALDTFVIRAGDTSIYPLDWYKTVLEPSLPPWIKWYGRPSSQFYELPHIEISNWRELAKEGILKLVEDIPVVS